NELQTRIRELRELDAKQPPLPTGLGTAIGERFGIPPSRRIGDLKRALEEACERGELEERREDAYYLDWPGESRAGLPVIWPGRPPAGENGESKKARQVGSRGFYQVRSRASRHSAKKDLHAPRGARLPRARGGPPRRRTHGVPARQARKARVPRRCQAGER